MLHALGTLTLVVLTQVPAPQPVSEQGAALRAEREAIRAKEASQLRTVAEQLRAEGKKAESASVEALIEPAPAPHGATRFAPLAEVVAGTKGLANVPAGGSIPAKPRSEIQAARSRAAKDLMALAQKAAAARRYALAGDCLRAVLARQPDHAEARRLLGYVPYQGGWATPFAARMLKEGYVDHRTFGWVPADWVPHLDAGELPAPTRSRGQKVKWLPAQEADRLRENFENGWIITTEHFQIRTNVPMSEAIAFGRQIEAFYDLFFAVMADVIESDRLPLARRFADPKLTARVNDKLHLVCYFADKQQYVNFLTPKLGPNIDETIGVYIMPREAKALHQRPTSYFFRDRNHQLAESATLYHEVSHQLLFETAGEGRIDRNFGNYWVFEGLGTYFETLEARPDSSLEVGGLVGPRIDLAKQQLLDQKLFIPIGQLVAMGKTEFNAQQGGDVHLNYAEANALAVFLMQFDRGRYRDDFLDYVRFAYKGLIGRGSSHQLDALLGVPYERLDEQFLEFLAGGTREREGKPAGAL